MSNLTHAQVLKMEAGPELDALIAERVMGIDLSTICDGEPEFEPWPGYCTKCGYSFSAEEEDWRDDHLPPPHRYSTDIAAAWEVFEKMAIETVGIREFVSIACGDVKGERLWLAHSVGDEDGAPAPTAPLAICRAALLTTLARDVTPTSSG